ncbi:MAG: protein-glutamate O-methyltransferase CheR [Lachnospiraceae bacterium]
MLEISQRDFKRLVTFVKSNYGIDLSKKQQLIVGRLSNTILSMGFNNFSDYVDYILSKKNPQDLDSMLNKLTTNYTFFMREESHFNFLRETILPYLISTKKDRVLSVWSAGCSSGQEPYTISMIIKEFLGGQASQWDTRVLATDISKNALNAATSAVYDEEALKELPPGWKSKYFAKTEQQGVFTVSPAIKSNVIFRTFNLMDPIQFRIKFDIIFCRNVMIYFDLPTKNALINRFYNATNQGGYLLIGHSESLDKESTAYQYLMPATYRKL